tara:strand:- start:4061 stop:6175 length:2115 start_codon:yes stop_codon:yes gene_type:complete
MKISILLPYKENFSPTYAGAVSLFVKDTSNHSNFKTEILVYGNTKFKKKYRIQYKNLKLKKNIFNSKSKTYVNEFINQKEVQKSDIIEIHNRPIYAKYILEKLKVPIVLYYHNDPLSMNFSANEEHRLYLLNKCKFIVVISKFIKKRFIHNLNIDDELLNKIYVIPNSAEKIKDTDIIKLKEKIILFVGKLNHQKGYDIFGSSIIDILNRNKNWKSIVVGDEEKQNIVYSHPKLKLLGFVQHDKVLKLFEKSSIAVVPSRWEEPLGRTGIEASSRGCATIVSNKGGLPETINSGIILKKLNQKELVKQIQLLIDDHKKRKKIQINSIKNFKFDHRSISNKVDNMRRQIVKKNLFNINRQYKLKILHVTNFNQRYFGRLHFNTGTRLNNGFIRLGHNTLSLSDRDIVSFSKSLSDFSGSKYLNKIVFNTIKNFKPDLLVLGHADKINDKMLQNVKNDYKNIKIAQWFLDPLSRKGPDYTKNKLRVLDKINSVDASFITTDPDSLDFKINNSFYMPNPCDLSLDNLKNYQNETYFDMFYAISHGVHRGILKDTKVDEREIFVKKLLKKNKDIKFDIFGMSNRQPIWGTKFIEHLSYSRMGLNLSRGEPIKYYSSDRIAQLMGNGLLTFIDTRTQLNNFFNNNEIVFYKNIDDLSEKINKYKKDDRKAKMIARNGYNKYHKYFNSTNVANFIIHKTFGIKKKYFWDI